MRPYLLERLPLCRVDGALKRLDSGRTPPAWLSEPELAHLKTLRVAKRRREWLAGRLAAKRLLRRRLAASGIRALPREIAVLAQSGGKPRAFLRGLPFEGHLSISHSEGGALAVVSEAPVGADLERVRERAGSFDEAFVRDDESAAWPGHEGRTRLWTLKEAAAKLLGVGLGVDLREIRVEPPGRVFFLGRALERWEALGRPPVRARSRRSSRGGETDILSVAYTEG